MAHQQPRERTKCSHARTTHWNLGGVDRSNDMAAGDYFSFSCNRFLRILVLGSARNQIGYEEQRSGRRTHLGRNQRGDNRVHAVEQRAFRSH